MVRYGGRAAGQAAPCGGLVGVAYAGESVGSVEEVCEGEAGEEGAGQDGPGAAEREEVNAVCMHVYKHVLMHHSVRTNFRKISIKLYGVCCSSLYM